jgi:hypothetical protein
MFDARAFPNPERSPHEGKVQGDLEDDPVSLHTYVKPADLADGEAWRIAPFLAAVHCLGRMDQNLPPCGDSSSSLPPPITGPLKT